MRIVSLSPSLTEILIELGAESELVGVCEGDCVQKKEILRLGSPQAVPLSQVDALAPDWVLGDARENRPDQIQAVERKWKTNLFCVKKLEDVCDAITDLGRLVGKREEARRLNESIQREKSLNDQIFSQRPKKRTILLLGDPPYLTMNFDPYPSRLIEASGGLNVFREEPLEEFPVEMEEMIERNPEFLLLLRGPGPLCKKRLAPFRQVRIFSHLPIHLVEGRLLSRYGVQTIEALRTLRSIYGGTNRRLVPPRES